jgi:hypothetical protein
LWGGGGGGGLGVVLGVGIGALGLPLGIVFTGAAGWVGATYLLSRGIYRAIARSRLHTLERLVDRLAEQCEEMLT